MIRRLTSLAGIPLLIFLLIQASSMRPAIASGPVGESAIDSAAALDSLAHLLRSRITLDPEVAKEDVGVVVRSLSTDKTIFELNPSAELTPASTTKIVTAFTALSTLGVDYDIRTSLLARSPVRRGIINGDLYVKGYGDPDLSVGDIDLLVQAAVDQGLKEVRGDVVGDGGFFDLKFVRTEYSGDEDEVEALPPIAGLTVEKNLFTVIVSAPGTPDQPLNVQTYPRSSGFRIVSDARSVSAPVRRRVRRHRRRHSICSYRAIVGASNASATSRTPGSCATRMVADIPVRAECRRPRERWRPRGAHGAPERTPRVRQSPRVEPHLRIRSNHRSIQSNPPAPNRPTAPPSQGERRGPARRRADDHGSWHADRRAYRQLPV